MRKLTGAVFVSLDGVMQAPGGPDEDPSSGFRFGGWAQPLWGEMGPFEDLIMGDYDLLLGKRTYEIFAAYWPNNQDNPIGEKFQRINKYVLTHSDEDLEWDNSYRLCGDTTEAVAELGELRDRHAGVIHHEHVRRGVHLFEQTVDDDFLVGIHGRGKS